MSARKESPSQTAGPYVHIGCTPNAAGITGVYPQDLCAGIAPGAEGQIAVEGQVFDGAGDPVRDALVEIWHADAEGRYPARLEEGARGWARSATDGETGMFRFALSRPGRVPWPDGRPQAPHITFWIVARGINLGLHTRLYFEDEAEANAADPILGAITPPARARTLLARREAAGRYRFDIHLQGPDETVFFDI
ncbi:MAG: protocatechuate 3,4-dioxygenase subunit alpha [Pseudomonadota bacterium]